MHREFDPNDIRHLQMHAGDPTAESSGGHDHRGLYLLTAFLGILIAADLLLGFVFGSAGWKPFGVSLSMIAGLAGAGHVVYRTLEALSRRKVGADLALAQASLGALILGEPFVAAEVVFIALIGEVLESITFARTQREIARLLEHSPRTARVRREGVEREIPVIEVVVGDLVLVREGERIPVDGVVTTGRSSVNESALTGESIPVDKRPGDSAFSGTINEYGGLEIVAEKIGGETTLGQVLKMVTESHRRKANVERAADRYARYFLPIVEGTAAITIILGYILGWPDVWYRTVSVLVVACPCALVLATPATVLAAMAWLARHGILIKGGISLERLAACDTIAFDKTGTLTKGKPELTRLVTVGGATEEYLLKVAVTAEKESRHPLALLVQRIASERGIAPDEVAETLATPGAGIRTIREGDDLADERGRILVGNRRLLEEQSVAIDAELEAILADIDEKGETPILVAEGERVLGVLAARDAVRREAHDVIHDLKHLKIKEIAILTGDRLKAAKAVAKKVHVKIVEAGLLPADKARWIEERQAAGAKVAMIGDGINDAPALARADAGIALASIGADLAAEAGDIIALSDPLRSLPDLVKISRKTISIIRQNILLFAFGLNAVAMIAAAFGFLGPIPAAILHQAGSLFVLLNAMRLLWFGEWSDTPPGRLLAALAESMRHIDDRIDPDAIITMIWSRRKMLVRSLLAATALLYLTSGWSIIGPRETGVLRRGGRFLGILDPGLHLLLPAPFESLTRLRLGELRSVSLGFRATPNLSDAGESALRWESRHEGRTIARAEDEALMMTGDGRVVEVSAVAHYRVIDRPESVRLHVLAAASPESLLTPAFEGTTRDVVGSTSAEDLLTEKRSDVERLIKEELNRRAETYSLGITFVSVSLQDVHPPSAVVDAYRDVSRAESDRARLINEANAYRDRQLQLAEGRAAEILNAADANLSATVDRSKGEADRYRSRSEARSIAPGLTDGRLRAEMLSESLAGRRKVILDSSSLARRHLIVPDSLETPLPPSILGPPQPPASPK